MPFGIVAYALMFLLDNLSRNSCIHLVAKGRVLSSVSSLSALISEAAGSSLATLHAHLSSQVTLVPQRRVYLGVKTCEVFLCFVTIMFVLSIVLTPLFSLFYVTREGDRFLHRA